MRSYLVVGLLVVLAVLCLAVCCGPTIRSRIITGIVTDQTGSSAGAIVKVATRNRCRDLLVQRRRAYSLRRWRWATIRDR